MKPGHLLSALALFSALAPAARGDEAARERSAATARMIDARIDRALTRAGIAPTSQARDHELLRRLSLDLNGLIPEADEAKKFLRSRAEDRFDALAEELLAAPAFSRHMADIFTRAWVGRRREDAAKAFRAWLAEQIGAGRGLDAIARAVMTASSPRAPEFYFIRRWGAKAPEVAAQSARVFLGVQIQCAQCHDHPFTDWKQQQFHEFAAGFTNRPYAYRVGQENRLQAFEARFPFEIGERAAGQTRGLSRRAATAALMTHPDNPYFAKMAVNRLWKAMFGRGLIEPAEELEDQMGSHPQLLEALAQDFIASGYDARHLLRAIALTRAYRRSSRRAEGQPDPAAVLDGLGSSAAPEAREKAALAAQRELELYARAALRPLSPEQIVTSLLRATGAEPEERYPSKRKQELAIIRFRFLRGKLLETFERLYDDEAFSSPDSYQGTIPQALIMLNGEFINEAIRPDDGTTMEAILKRGSTGRQVERLFYAVLSRPPSKEEKAFFAAPLKDRARRARGGEDVMWALINSSEFLLNH